jgi:regulatory protein
MADPLSVALAYLNRRERTVAEVRAKLEGAEFTDAQIEPVLAELAELNMLNDARYAQLFTEDKRTLDAWGNDRIMRTLLERGIDRQLIAEVLSTDPDQGELARAVELLDRRFGEAGAQRRDRERAFGVLVRKGYDSELASDAVSMWSRG